MKSNKKIISFILSTALLSLNYSCGTAANISPTSVETKTGVNNLNKKQQYIFDLSPNSKKSGASVRISISGLVNKNSFSTKTLPSKRKTINDAATFKIGLTTNPDDPLNNIVGGNSSLFTVDANDSSVMFLNVPAGGTYYAVISMYDETGNNITQPNRKILLGGGDNSPDNLKAYVSENKVTVSYGNKLTFSNPDNSTDTRNYLSVNLVPAVAMPGDENFTVENSYIGSSSMSLNENGDGLIVFSDYSESAYRVYARRVESYVPVDAKEEIDVEADNYNNSDPKPVISLDKNGTGYVVWRSYNNEVPTIKARKITTFLLSSNESNNFGIKNISDLSDYDKYNPTVRVNTDNGEKAVFAWTDKTTDPANGDIYSKNIINGTLSSTTIVNTDGVGKFQDNASISNINSSGKGLIVWTDGRNYNSSNNDIYIKEINNFAVTTGSESKIIDSTENTNQTHPAVEINNNGDGVLVFNSTDNNAETVSLNARFIDNYIIDSNLYILDDSNINTNIKPVVFMNNPDLKDISILYNKFDSIYSINIKGTSMKTNIELLYNTGYSEPSISLNKKGNGLVVYNSNYQVYGRHLISDVPLDNVNQVAPFGAIASYPFDYLSTDTSFSSTAKDISGNNKNGNVNGSGITTASNRFAFSNRALNFHRNVNNYISVANSDQYFTLKKQFGFSLWAKTSDSSWASVSNSSLISNYEDGGFALQMNNNAIGSGKIGVITKIGGNIVKVTSDLSELDNGFHHFAGTFDGKTLRFYIDGEMKASETLDNISQIDYAYPTNNFIIGADAGSGTEAELMTFFNGIIDDVKVYDFAINDNEVYGLYKQGDNAPPP